MINADDKPTAPGRWQLARRKAAELPFDLPQAAPGTHVYIVTAGADQNTLLLLRALVRVAERAGHKVKLL